MTIYECLGIGEYLIDETIPTDLIIENIDRADLRYDAGVFFQDITRVSIRASLNRGNHFMQVVEVELNNVDHISEISVLIQKAIRYQVLFVFVYEDRYLILRRSFNLTTSTENVYTDHASFSTDWIYGECLEDDLVALFDTNEVIDCYDEDFELSFEPKKSDSDNGDHRYFDDVIGNAVSINRSVIESDVVSLRFLLDWWTLHIVGSRVNIYDVLDRVRDVQAYQMIGNYLFVEKDCVRYAISELEHSEYTVSFDHTGRNPMFYFGNSSEMATYADADKLMLYLLYGSEKDEFESGSAVEELPADVKHYVGSVQSGGIIPNTTQSTPRLGFIDEIIRRHQLRGYHLIEDQPLRDSIVRRLRVKGYQILEQFRSKSISEIDFLSPAMQVELLLCLDKIGIRFEECSKVEYSDILDYIKASYTCSLCGNPLDNTHITDNKCLCTACQIRLEHLAEEKAFCVACESLEWNDDDLTTLLNVTFALDENEIFELSERLELKDAYIMLNDSTLYRCDSSQFSVANEDDEDAFFDEVTKLHVAWSSNDYGFSSDNLEYVHLVLKDKNSETFYLFIFRFEDNSLELYDYIGSLDYNAYKAKRAKQELNILISIIEDNLDERISVETCVENMVLPEIKALFEQHYIKENGFYYNHDKTTLVMCEDSECLALVDIPESVKVIGRSAFRGVNEIGSITLPSGLTEISSYAFFGVAFGNDIVLPNSVTKIGRRAFYRAKTPSDSINIPTMLDDVDRLAFPARWSLYCKDAGDNLSQGVKTILATTKNEVLFGADQKPTVIEEGSNRQFSWKLTSANELFIYATGEFSPYRWDSDKDTEWRKYARRITKLVFSPGITSVAGSAFEGCDNICEVIFPDSVQFLDSYTLKHTTWYKNLDSKYSVICDECLVKVITDDTTLVVPDNIKYISRVTDSINSESQMCPNLRHIVLGNGVHSLLPFAFYRSAIETVLFNEELQEVGQQSLAYCCNLRFLCLPNNVRTIGYEAFSYSNRLECVVLPEKLESIDSGAFDGCYWLEKIIVPFDKEEFSKKVKKTFGQDKFPYDKCVYSTTVDDRKITKEYQMITRKRTKWESRPVTLSNHPAIKEPLARTLRKYGLHTIEDLRKWGAKEVWEYIYKREQYPSLSFNSLVKLVLADEGISEISQERLVELYDFADSVTGNKLERKLLKAQVDDEPESLKGLQNIGSSMRSRLHSIGINTITDLMRTDTKVIWDRLYEKSSYTDCVEIWSVEGAKRGVLYADLDVALKAELKEYVDCRKGREKPNPEELTALPNIGVGLAEKLKSIGVTTSSALKEETTESVWDRLYQTYPSVGCFEIYAIEGAKLRVKMGNLDGSRRERLKQYVKAQKSPTQHENANTNEAYRFEEERKKAEEAIRVLEEKQKTEETRKLEEKCLMQETEDTVEETRRILEEKRKQENESRLKEYKMRGILQLVSVLKEVHDIRFEKQKRELLCELLCLLNKIIEKKREDENLRQLEFLRIEKERRLIEQIRLMEERKNCIYESALKKYNSDSIDELKSAIKQFAEIGEWKDTLVQINKFQARICYLIDEQKKAEAIRLEQKGKNDKYNQAIRMFESDNISELKSAVSLLEEIEEWKDSCFQIRRFKKKISSILREQEEKQKAIYRSQKCCQHCGGKFKGLFSKCCSVCGKPKDY